MGLRPRYTVAERRYSSGWRPEDKWMVRDTKDACAVSLHPTKEAAETEATRLDAEREARIMHGRMK